MKNTLFNCLILLLLTTSFSCKRPHSNRVIIIQPFTDIPPSLIATVYNHIKETNPKTILRQAIPLPGS
jgi:hypothetical protein